MVNSGGELDTRTRVQSWIALGIVYVVWGSTYLAIRVGVGHVPPLLLAGIRYVIAGALLYPIASRASAGHRGSGPTAGGGRPAARCVRAPERGWPAPSSASCCCSAATAG